MPCPIEGFSPQIGHGCCQTMARRAVRGSAQTACRSRPVCSTWRIDRPTAGMRSLRLPSTEFSAVHSRAWIHAYRHGCRLWAYIINPLLVNSTRRALERGGASWIRGDNCRQLFCRLQTMLNVIVCVDEHENMSLAVSVMPDACVFCCDIMEHVIMHIMFIDLWQPN